MTEEETVKQFLGDRPGSDQLREWREALEQRLGAMQGERKRILDGSGAALDAKMEQLRRQIDALLEEEAVTKYVEDSVRVTLAMGVGAEGDEFEE